MYKEEEPEIYCLLDKRSDEKVSAEPEV